MARIDTSNPQSGKSVNAKCGPTTGNMNPGSKRTELKARREQASALSDVINRALGAREEDSPESIFPNEGSLAQTVKPRKFKR